MTFRGWEFLFADFLTPRAVKVCPYLVVTE